MNRYRSPLLCYSLSVTFREVREKAIAQGYSLCPAELALSLRLAYLNQPFDERLVIAMEPIRDNRTAGYPYVFTVEHYTGMQKGLWLSHLVAFDNGGGFFELSLSIPIVFIGKDS